MSLYLGTNCISAGGSSAFKNNNVGEIIQSTIPLTDAGLHLLDGSVISGSGSYSAFVTHIAGLVSGHSELFTTEANWQTSVTNYGVCGKFVYDSINNTVRLPKYSDKFWSGLGTAGVKGNGITLGLTDGTNNAAISLTSNPYITDNNSYGQNVGSSASGHPLSVGKSLGITTDPTKSGIVADLSTITTALDGYWYIVIATSTKTEIEVDIDEIATDLNGKADVDLSNVNVSGTSLASGWAMPSSRYIDLTLGASGATYTAPANGWFCVSGYNNSNPTGSVTIRSGDLRIISNASSHEYGCAVIFPVKKGKSVYIDYRNITDWITKKFVYSEGDA